MRAVVFSDGTNCGQGGVGQASGGAEPEDPAVTRGPDGRQAGWPGMWVSSAQARQPRTLHPTRCGRDAQGAGLVHRAPSKVGPFTQQAPVEHLLCAGSVLGAGPTGLKKCTGPCPCGTSVLEREDIVTSLPTCARWVLLAAQDHTASSRPRGLFCWPVFSSSRLSTALTHECRSLGSQASRKLQRIPAFVCPWGPLLPPGFVSLECHLEEMN